MASQRPARIRVTLDLFTADIDDIHIRDNESESGLTSRGEIEIARQLEAITGVDEGSIEFEQLSIAPEQDGE